MSGRPDVDALESRLDFETLLSDLSSRFLNLAPADVDREIGEGLGRLCELLGIDFAVLWQWSTVRADTFVATHTYPAGDGPRLPAAGSQNEYPWTTAQILAGRTIVLRSLEDLPPEAAVDRESARSAGIRSNLTVPLAVGGKPPVGALALNTLREERDWPQAVVDRLGLIVRVFANALARRPADEALRTNTAHPAVDAELGGIGFYEVDLAGGGMKSDACVRDLCGVPADRVGGLGVLEFWLEHIHLGDRPRVLDERTRFHDGTLERLSIEYRYVHPSRGPLLIQHLAGVAARDENGRALRTFGVLRDVTERAKAEAALRDLSRRLIRAHEEERALLGRELHDDLSQRLALLAIDAGRAELSADPSSPHAKTLRSLREGLISLSEDVHVLAYQLHPSVLEELGLADALRTECERRARSSGLAVAVSIVAATEAVGKEKALCLFRVAQEALGNVVRHAGAHSASLDLRERDGGLLLTVRDDGTGFDPAEKRERQSLGLASMRERVALVALVDGTLLIESAPGKGTSIVAWVPGEAGSQ